MSAGIKVERKVANINGQEMTVLKIAKGGKRVATVKYEGAVRSMEMNATKTIWAINLEPGTQINDVYLLDLLPSGETLVIKDFNDKLEQDPSRPHFARRTTGDHILMAHFVSHS